jgi:hypothetical protein
MSPPSRNKQGMDIEKQPTNPKEQNEKMPEEILIWLIG